MIIYYIYIYIFPSNFKYIHYLHININSNKFETLFVLVKLKNLFVKLNDEDEQINLNNDYQIFFLD